MTENSNAFKRHNTQHHTSGAFSCLYVVTCLLIIVTLLAVPVLKWAESATKPFTMAYLAEPEENVLMLGFHLIYVEAFRRLGMELTYKVYPPTRASVMLNAGKVDGEAGRIKGYEERYPNIIMVNEPIAVPALLAVAKDPEIRLSHWEDLRGTDYRVDYFRGIVIAEKILPGVVKAENLSAVSDPVQAFKKLLAGRTDIYVDVDGRILLLLASPEFKDSGIRLLEVVEKIPNHPYVHKRHAGLAPRLANVLKQMKTEGLFEQYMEQAQQQFAQTK